MKPSRCPLCGRDRTQTTIITVYRASREEHEVCVCYEGGRSGTFFDWTDEEGEMAAEPATGRAMSQANEVERLREALQEVVDQDPVELALDPEWVQRIAADALAETPQGQWQEEPPTEPGWYWVWWTDEEVREAVQIYKVDGLTIISGIDDPATFALWWSEPIQEPLEPEGGETERPWLRYEREIAKALYPRIHAWISAGMPPAQTAFTAGLERVVAQLCEEAVRAEDQENHPEGG